MPDETDETDETPSKETEKRPTTQLKPAEIPGEAVVKALELAGRIVTRRGGESEGTWLERMGHVANALLAKTYGLRR